MKAIGVILASLLMIAGVFWTGKREEPAAWVYSRGGDDPTANRVINGNLRSVQYVTSSGRDSNDGTSWSAAKHTIFAALAALPGGSANGGIAGSGTVYLSDEASANPNPGGGIWIMGSNDPNYSHPPPGWLKTDKGSIRIVGVGCHSYSSSTPIPKCHVLSGSDATAWKPAIWISGSSSSITFENLTFSYPGKVIALGITSAGDRSSGRGGAVNVRFENVSGGLNQSSRLGPAVDIGSNTFNIYFEHTSFDGNPSETAAIASDGLSRSNGVLTVKTSAAMHFANGEKCGILQARDASFNGSFGGLGITVQSSNQFTATQEGPNAASGGGFVVCDRALPIVMDPGTGANLGLVWFRDTVLHGGGIRSWSSSAGSSLYVDGMLLEGDFVHPTGAPVWIGSTAGSQSIIVVRNIVIADTVGNWNFIVQNDAHNASDQVLVEGCPSSGGCLFGPGTVLGGSTQNSPYNPLGSGQVGFFNGHVLGQVDAARSAPQSVRFPNLANTNAKQWYLNNASNGNALKVGVTDRDGGSQAVRASTSASGQQNLFFGVPTFVPSIGDIIVCGAWVRSLAPYDYGAMNGAGYSGNAVQPLSCGLHGLSYTTTWSSHHEAVNAGDNEWEWVSIAYKIGSLKGAPDYIPFGVYFDAKHPIEAYSPVFVRVPAGALSDGEAANLVQNLRGYSNSCTVGEVCDMSGPLVHLNEENEWPLPQYFSSVVVGSKSSQSDDKSNPKGSIAYASEFSRGQCFSSAMPANCAGYIAGFVAVPAGESSIVVDSSAVTDQSEISLTFDATQGSHLHVKCNSAAQQPFISARAAQHNFTIGVPSKFVGNPGCIGFRIIN
jgi:hypothetical protein